MKKQSSWPGALENRLGGLLGDLGPVVLTLLKSLPNLIEPGIALLRLRNRFSNQGNEFGKAK